MTRRRPVPGQNGHLLLILFTLLSLAILGGAPTAVAATFTVNSTTDGVDALPGDGICATSGGICTLRAAVQEARQLSGSNTINLPAGVYALTIAGAGSAAGDLDVGGDVTIVGAGSGVTTIDATDLSDRIFDVNGAGLTLVGLTLTGGDVSGNGGALTLAEASAHLTDVIISGNNASGKGDGIYAGSASVTLVDSFLGGNSAGQENGIWLDDYYTELELQDSDIGDDIVNDGVLYLTGSSGGVIDGAISGGSIDKSGGGQYALNGPVEANGVTVTGGGLAVNNTLIIPEGAVEVAAGGILLGSGLVNAFVFVDGTLAPGDSLGILTVAGLQLNGSAVVEVEVGGDVPGAGGYDQTAVTSSVEIINAALTFLDVGYTPLDGQQYVVIDNQSGSPVSGAFAGLPEGALVSSNFLGSGRPAFITYAGGDGDDVVVSVGDPSQSSPFIVNTLDDSDDGRCGAGHCSLREAINAANTAPNGAAPDEIQFAVSGTIQPGSPLPAIVDAAVLDGGSAPAGIVLDGAAAGTDTHGLTINGNGSAVQGLTITGFDGAGIAVVGGQGNTLAGNSITGNGRLGIDLGADGVTLSDFFDLDAGPNGLQNSPIVQRAFTSGAETTIQGYVNTTVNGDITITLYGNANCDPSFYGEGETLLATTTVTTDARGYARFLVTLPTSLADGTAVTALATSDATGDTSEFSRCTAVGPNNDTWPNAFPVPLTPAGGSAAGSAQQYLTAPGQTRWFKFAVPPNSTVVVDLTSLPTDYDLVLFRDIAQSYAGLQAPADLDDLVELNAEFAPEMFTPEMFTPEMFTPEMFTPEMFTPEMFTPEMFTPEMFTPEMFTPEMFTPEMFTPEMFTPEMFTPEMFTPEMFTQGTFTPEIFTPEMFTPEMFTPDQRYYAAAQAQSAVAVSAFDGTAPESVTANSWNEAGDFYVSVNGRNGAFDPTIPFQLDVAVLGAACNGLTTFDITPDVSGVPAGGYETLILVDYDRMSGNLTTLQTRLGQLAAHPAVNGDVVDVSDFPAAALNGSPVTGYPSAVDLANAEADALYTCVFAKNTVAQTIKQIVDAYRGQNPGLRYIVIAGNDNVIPFFRYPDLGLLANEDNYIPPVDDLTTSQASLRGGYILSQDTYGAAVTLDRRNTTLVVPQLAVGRLVETASEMVGVVDAFLASGGVVPAPSTALVTGYDFLSDAATAVQGELAAGLGAGGTVDSLIDAATVAPANGWTAGDLRGALLQSGRHDLIFLAGHFSAFSALAADYNTRLLASEIAASSVDMTNAIIFSNGCHSSYNIVNEHGVPLVTVEPDWAQAFARKGAILIGGTGYQYGDTDFIEYSERLYFEFSRELRRGSGPVAVGEALVRAKQIYLAETADMRPIHEKALAISTLFGLPMLTIDMPGARYNPAPDPSLVGATSPFVNNPGQTLGLTYADVTVTPALQPVVKPLTNIVDDTTTDALYYRVAGSDRLVVNPGEPIRPLDRYDVGVAGEVLRGVGFRGGSYHDVADQIPLTGAAVTELRGIHTPFIANVFYPIRPWDVNYFDALANPAAGSGIGLGVIPVQYRSNAPDAVAGTMRVYDDMAFRLYYSDNTSSYTNAAAGVTNVPALSGPPAISRVLAASGGGQVDFEVTVTGDPSAGIQEVWVTYTGLDLPFYGSWQSLSLTQDVNDSRVWRGPLDLQGMPSTSLRYIVQAANGVGLVSLATNKGAYYEPDVDPGAPSSGTGGLTPAPVSLTLLNPPADGVYGTAVTVSAQLTSGGAPLPGETLVFGLTTQRQTAVTDANGVATVALTLIDEPVVDTVRVIYAGRPGLAAGADGAPFEIKPIATSLTVQTVTPTYSPSSGAADLTISLADNTGRPLPHKGVLILIRDSVAGAIVFGEQVITDLYGDAHLRAVNLTGGSYEVSATFASTVVVNGVTVDATTARYLPAQSPSAGEPPLLLIPNTPPVADAGGPYAAALGGAVVLDAGGSSDADAGQLLRYAWDLDDDGLYETAGVTATFPATAVGLHPVAVQVCDPVNDCNTATSTVDVTSFTLFTIAISPTAAAYEGQPVTLTAVLSPGAPPGPFTINWTFGDGSAATGTLSPTHTYAAPGVYDVTISVTSPSGATATDAAQVVVLHSFMQACAYAAGDLTLEKDTHIDCTAQAGGDLVVKKDVFVGGSLVAVGGDVTVEKSAVIGGDLLSAGAVTLKKETAVGGDVTAGDDVRLEMDAGVGGDVRSAGQVTLGTGATVGGDIFQNTAPPLLPPDSPLYLSLSAGGPDIVVGRYGTLSLPPGVYGALTVEKGATLQFSSGQYQFDAWDIRQDVAVTFDVSGGPIIVDVVGNIALDKNLSMSVAGGGAEFVLFRSTGDSFQADKDSRLVGTYLLPQADASLEQEITLTGAIYAHTLQVKKDVQIIGQPALPALIAMPGAPG